MQDISWALNAVHIGGEYLDDRRPGWYREIDVRTLDLTQDGSCILGQLYGSYQDAAYDVLGLSFWDVCRFGFHVFHGDSTGLIRAQERLMFVSDGGEGLSRRIAAHYAMIFELEYAWKELIRERLGVVGSN